MKFTVTKRAEYDIERSSTGACFLETDNWDDYSFKTSFVLFYLSSDRELRRIGPVKIMHEGQQEGERVSLPVSPFSALDQNYCSLGQEQAYYEELAALDERTREEILIGLRDCVYQPEIYSKFQNEQAMSTSLLRDISIEKIKLLYKSILDGNIELTPYVLSFLLNNKNDLRIDISVSPDSTPPTNVHVLIGRNGVGKTRLLSGIADSIAGSNDGKYGLPVKFSSHSNAPNKDYWHHAAPKMGKLTNLVIVAFSAFDKFAPIKGERLKSDIQYQYVGLRSGELDGQFKSQKKLNEDFSTSLGICLDTQRKKRWVDAIKILNSDPILSEYGLHELPGWPESSEKIVDIFRNLSSGHRIILLTVTRLVELVDEGTLVLIDEPENHLHPPLLSSFIRALSDLLIKRNGVALVATHSPVVLQEVPTSCVTVINRVGEEYSFSRPTIETFAENIGTLTRDVFNLEVLDSGYHKILNSYLAHDNYDQIIERFKGQIGAEGRAIIRAILASRSE